MAIVIKIRPQLVKATSKHELLRKIGYGFDSVYGGFLSGITLINRKTNTLRFYNLHKLNRKVLVTEKTITRGKNKGQVIKNREVIREAHWIAYTYDVPRDMVVSAKQNTRNFTIKMK